MGTHGCPDGQLSKTGCGCADSRPVRTAEIDRAIADLTPIIQIGRQLSAIPWVLDAYAPQVAVLKKWLGDVWDEVKPETAPCGTDFLSYLPFDPTVMPGLAHFYRVWDSAEMFEVEWGMGGPGMEEAISRGRSPWVRTSVRNLARRSGAFSDQPEGGGFEPPATQQWRDGGGATIRTTGRPSSGPRLPWDQETGTSGFTCSDLESLLTVTDTEFNRRAGNGKRNGRGALLVGPSPFSRPLFSVICSYLRAYWEDLYRLGVTEPTPAGDVHPAWPYVSTGPIDPRRMREEISGWPPWVLPEVPWRAKPGGRLTDEAGGTWLRFGAFESSRIFVLRRGWAGGTTEPEASVIGLALQLLRVTMPEWRAWESEYVSEPFELLYKGSGTNHKSLMDVFEDCYSGPASSAPPLFIFTLPWAEGNRAQGRGHPADGSITIATNPPDWADFGNAVTALVDLRRTAFIEQMNGRFPFGWGGSPGPAPGGWASPGDFTTRVWNLVDPLIRIAELILHESGHTLATTQINDAVTGVADDWHQGNTNTNAFWDIHEYEFPRMASLTQSRHNGLTVAGGWIECLMRNNRRPRDRMVRNACQCAGKNNRMFARANPHYGGWGRDDDVCNEGRFEGWHFENRHCRL